MEKNENQETEIFVCKRCGEETFGADMRHYRGKVTELCKKCYASSKKLQFVEKANMEEKSLVRTYTNPELSKFTPRQLLDELAARGYHGELYYTTKVKI